MSSIIDFSSLLMDFEKLGYVDVHHSNGSIEETANISVPLGKGSNNDASGSCTQFYGVHVPCIFPTKKEVMNEFSDQSDLINIVKILGSANKFDSPGQYCSNILKNFGDLMVSRGYFNDAINAFRGALDLSCGIDKEENDNNKSWHPIRDSICAIHIKRQDWKMLRVELNTKLLSHQDKNEIDKALTLQRMGDTCRLENNIDESMKFYTDAVLLLRDHNNNKNRTCAINLLHRIGDLNFIQNHHEIAKDYYLEALRLGDHNSEEVKVSTIVHKLGLVLNKLGHYEEALTIFHQAIALKTNEETTIHNNNDSTIEILKPLPGICPFYDFDISYQQISSLEILKNISTIQQEEKHADLPMDDHNINYHLEIEEKRVEHPIFKTSHYPSQVKDHKALKRVMLSSHPKTGSSQRLRQVKFCNPIVDRIKIIPRIKKESIRELFYSRQEINRFRQEQRSTKHTSDQTHFEYAATFLESIGRKKFKEGSYDLALKAYARALRVKTEVLGNDHISTSDTVLKIGDVYFKQRSFTKALGAFDAALKLRKSALGECHLSVSMTYNKMAIVYEYLGELSEAIFMHGKTLAIRNSILGSQHILVASSKQAIGLLHFQTQQFESALTCFKETLKIQTSHFGTQQQAEIACTLNSIGDTYFAMNDMNLALITYEKALQIMREDPIDKNDDIASILNNIGSVYIVKHKYKRSMCFYGDALTSIQDGSKNPFIMTKILNNIGDALSGMGEKENASIAYNKAMDLKNKMNNDEKEEPLSY